MKYYTHIASSVAMSIALTQVTDSTLTISVLAGVVIGSLLPDIDEPKSYVGSKSLGAAHIVKGIFGHRGFTHSILALLLVMIPLFYHGDIDLIKAGEATGFIMFWTGLSMGYMFHMIGDLFSVSGIPLLYPIKKRTAIPVYKTGTWLEKIIFIACVVWIFYQANHITLEL
jgi:inner membrane protein